MTFFISQTALIAYGNNTDYSTAFRDAGNDSVLAESESYMLKRSNDSFVVTFTSGENDASQPVGEVMSVLNRALTD